MNNNNNNKQMRSSEEEEDEKIREKPYGNAYIHEQSSKKKES